MGPLSDIFWGTASWAATSAANALHRLRRPRVVVHDKPLAEVIRERTERRRDAYDRARRRKR